MNFDPKVILLVDGNTPANGTNNFVAVSGDADRVPGNAGQQIYY